MFIYTVDSFLFFLGLNLSHFSVWFSFYLGIILFVIGANVKTGQTENEWKILCMKTAEAYFKSVSLRNLDCV